MAAKLRGKPVLVQVCGASADGMNQRVRGPGAARRHSRLALAPSSTSQMPCGEDAVVTVDHGRSRSRWPASLRRYGEYGHRPLQCPAVPSPCAALSADRNKSSAFTVNT